MKITLLDFLNSFKKNWKPHFLLVLVIIMGSFTFRSVQDISYKSSAVLINNLTSIESRTTGVGDVLAAAGFGLDLGSSSVDESALSLRMIKSRDFYREIFSNEELFQLIFPTAETDYYGIDENEKFEISFSQFYGTIFSFNLNKSTNFFEANMYLQNGNDAKKALEEVIKLFNNYRQSKDLAMSKSGLEIVQNILIDTSEVELRNVLSSIAESYLTKIVNANIAQNYAVDYVEKPHLPILPERTPLSSFLIIVIIISLFCSAILQLVKLRYA